MAEKLLDRMRRIIRLKHYSLRTEKAYLHWAKRYILFHGNPNTYTPTPIVDTHAADHTAFRAPSPLEAFD